MQAVFATVFVCLVATLVAKPLETPTILMQPDALPEVTPKINNLPLHSGEDLKVLAPLHPVRRLILALIVVEETERRDLSQIVGDPIESRCWPNSYLWPYFTNVFNGHRPY